MSQDALWKEQVGEFFGTLPKEVVMKIFEYAVIPTKKIKVSVNSSASGTETEPILITEGEENVSAGAEGSEPTKITEREETVQKLIKPTQVCEKSNKFLWGSYKLVRSKGVQDRKISTEDEMLAAPALMATCKAFYRIMNESAIFYGSNRFEFTSAEQMLRYLSSITPSRIKDIRNITYYVCAGWKLDAECTTSQAFTLLSSCTMLKSFTIRLSIKDYHWASGNDKLKKSISKIRCEKLDVSIVDWELVLKYPFYSIQLPNPTPEHPEAHRAGLEAALSGVFDALTKGPPAKVPDEDFVEARQASCVMIHGDGRLSGEAKPGLVSSRTRGSMARQTLVDADGVIPARKLKKFNLEGSLTWDIECCKKNREIMDQETNQSTLQILVEWKNPVAQRIGAKNSLSWECLEVLLTNPQTHRRLWDYWTITRLWKTSDAAQIVLDAAIAEYGVESDRFRTYDGRWYSSSSLVIIGLQKCVRDREKYLAQEAKKELLEEQKAAEDAAKAAAKAAAKPPKPVAGQKRKRKNNGSSN